MDPASGRESLARRYAELGDAELRSLAHGDLDNVSLEIAHAELQSRAFRRMPAPESVSLPDSFAADPYAPPQTRDSEATDAPSRRTQLGAVLWWSYVAILAVLALRSAHVSALRPGGTIQASLVNFGILAWGCIGLIGWRLRKPLLWRWLWAASALLAWLVVALMLLSGVVVSILAVNDPSQWRSVWMAAGMFLLLLPLASGLSTYAFHTKTIW